MLIQQNELNLLPAKLKFSGSPLWFVESNSNEAKSITQINLSGFDKTF